MRFGYMTIMSRHVISVTHCTYYLLYLYTTTSVKMDALRKKRQENKTKQNKTRKVGKKNNKLHRKNNKQQKNVYIKQAK